MIVGRELTRGSDRDGSPRLTTSPKIAMLTDVAASKAASAASASTGRKAIHALDLDMVLNDDRAR